MIAPTVKDDMGAVIEEYAEPIEPVEFKRLLSIYRENDRILPRALEIVKTQTHGVSLTEMRVIF